MKMRYRLSACMAALGLAVAANTAEARELGLGHSLSDTSHYGLGADAFAERLAELSDGAFTVTEHAAGALGGERAMIEGLQIGTVDLVITSTGPLGNFVPETYVLDLPFLFESYEQARCILDGEVGQDLLAEIDKRNLIGLAWSENGFRHITNSRNPVEKPEDLQGLKVRTMENQIHMQSFEALGASPTPMAFPELFTALQQGTVDGQENPTAVITATSFWEVQDYMTRTGHFYSPAVVLASPVLWDALNDEEKEWFHEAAAVAVEATRAEVIRLEEDGVKLLEDEGMEVRGEVDIEPFQQAVQGVYDSFKDRYGEAYLERIMNDEQCGG